MIENKYNHIFQSIQLILEDELKLRGEYCTVSVQERKAMTKFDTGTIEKLTSRKEEILEKLQKNSQQLKELMSTFPNCEANTLSVLVKTYATRDERKSLLSLIDKIRQISKATKRSSLEINALASFSLSMIHSLLSIIWSGTLGIAKSYGKKGNLKESFHPLGSRSKNTLKEA